MENSKKITAKEWEVVGDNCHTDSCPGDIGPGDNCHPSRATKYPIFYWSGTDKPLNTTKAVKTQAVHSLLNPVLPG